jgi:hypothetical protein
MAPVLSLEPLKNGVLGLAGAVLLLAGFLLIQRTLTFFANSRAALREPILTRVVYDAIQSSPVSAEPLARLSRSDRKLIRSILLGLALDLRGETSEAISQLYVQLGFARQTVRWR